jgi:hypothetical protein
MSNTVKIINTTNQVVRTEILGTQYEIEPQGFIENVPEADAEYWVTKIHEFLIVEQEGKITAPSKDETPNEEETEEVKTDGEEAKEVAAPVVKKTTVKTAAKKSK